MGEFSTYVSAMPRDAGFPVRFSHVDTAANAMNAPRVKKAMRSPWLNAAPTPSPPAVTASRLGSNPNAPILMVTMVMASPIPVTLAVLRTMFVKAVATPILLRSTVPRIEL